MRMKYKKILIVTMSAVCFVISNAGKAQTPISIFVHGLTVIPVDNSSQNRYSAGLGAEAGIQYGKKSTFVTGTVGYTNFFAKTLTVAGVTNLGSLTYIPIRAGVRQNLAALFYIHGDAGIGFLSYKDTSFTDSRFSFDAGAGIHFSDFEVELAGDAFKEIKPDGWSSWFGIKAGWRIQF